MIEIIFIQCIKNFIIQYAKIEKQIVSIGVVDRAEIWAKEEWESYNGSENFVDSSLAGKMADLGI